MLVEPLTVIRHLATLSEPVDMRDLSEALGCHNYPEKLRNVVATLVRNRQVIRHHREDGILRYSLANATAPALYATGGHLSALDNAPPVAAEAAVPVPASATQATAAPAANTRHDHSSKSKEMQFLDHVPSVPISAPELAARSGFPMSTVANLLQRLKLKGLVRKHGNYRGATWSRVAQTPAATKQEQPPVAQQQPVDLASPVANVELGRALTENAEAAEEALDTYVRSVVDQGIYDRLRQCANKAREALAIYKKGAAA